VNVFPSATASKEKPASRVLGAVTFTVAGVDMVELDKQYVLLLQTKSA
jgi:hypothetical protein